MKKLIGIIAMLCMTGLSVQLAEVGGNAAGPVGGSADDPLNATYLIGGNSIRLIDGRCRISAAPGSATKILTTVFGKPEYGDMDGDGDEDSALLLVHDPGGSGTFFYAAVALNVINGYQGINAVLLGDRIIPQDMRIRNGAVVIKHADRRPEDPMSTEPTVIKTRYLVLKNDKLVEATASYKGGQFFEGRVRIGHEVRSFEPCNRKKALWLAGESPALAEIIAAYRRSLPRAKPYQPLFMVLAGKWVVPPADGFGAEYEAAFMATQLVRVVPGRDCTEEDSVFDSHTGFSPKITFDLTRLDDSGLLGSADARRALAYEFCIPATAQFKAEVERIDSTVQFMAESPGRIGCGKGEFLCIGSSHQKDFRKVLQQLAILPYVQRIDEAFFE